MSGEEPFRIDPWSAALIERYERLFNVFGIRPFKEVLPFFNETPHHLMRRGIVFGHRDFDSVLKAFNDGKRIALLTGLMPSGRFHFGHKMVFDQIIFYQKMGFDVFIAIADIEAYAVRRVPREKLIEIALNEYVANAIALGLKKNNLHIYFQSNMSAPYYRLMQLAGQKATMAEMRAIYGELTPGKIISVFTQVADILHPMLKEYGGYDYVFVPVGADQDPHIRFTRDIADRFELSIGLKRPASTYHRLMRGLDGGKMSSSKPDSAIFLSDSPETVAKKIKRALTGGRATVEEQRRLGGEPDKCSVYEVYLYHLILDDKELADIRLKCLSGELLCGECKSIAVDKMVKWLREHQRRLKRAKDIVHEYVEVPGF